MGYFWLSITLIFYLNVFIEFLCLRDIRINEYLQGLQASLFKFFNKSLQKIESNPIIHLLLQYRIIKLLNNFVGVSWLNNFLLCLI